MDYCLFYRNKNIIFERYSKTFLHDSFFLNKSYSALTFIKITYSIDYDNNSKKN
jgi:hypothetical protein